MNIQVLLNGVKDKINTQTGITKALSLCSSVGLNLNPSYVEINKIFDSQAVQSDIVNGFGINPQEILAYATGKPDIVLLISTYAKIKPFNFSTANPINPCTYDLSKTTLNNTIVMEICEEWYNDYPDVLSQFLLHELCHFMYYKTGVSPDLTHFQYANSAYSQKQPSDYYLFLITNLIRKMQSTYKYFVPSEIVGLQSNLVALLDQARDIAGVPFKITSGLRTAQSNIIVGGVSDSSHLTGNAVDLFCNDSVNRLKIVSALLKVGFNRIGIYLDHIHCDNSSVLPQNVMWCLDKE